jgi:hypothetical protein
VRLSYVEFFGLRHFQILLQASSLFNSFALASGKIATCTGNMPTLQDVQAKLAAIEQRKAQTLKDLQAKRLKLKAQLAQLQRPTKSQRRLDARRKILLGAFVLEQMQHAGIQPSGLTFQGKRFFDWLIRPTDRDVFEALTVDFPISEAPSSAGSSASGTRSMFPSQIKTKSKR